MRSFLALEGMKVAKDCMFVYFLLNSHAEFSSVVSLSKSHIEKAA